MGAEPYPPIDRWEFPRAAIAATLAAVAPAGGRGREAGVIWLGKRGATSVIGAVAWPHGDGVTEARGWWSVSPEVYGAIARVSRAHQLTLLGSAHTHARGVRVALSTTDRRHGTRAPGVLAIVIGNGGTDTNPARWSWNVFDDGDWRELDHVERRDRVSITDAPIRLWRADRHGARPWELGRV